MDKKRGGRPRAEYPYVCGPYRVRQRWRLVIVTGRTSRGRQSYNRAFDSRELATAWCREFKRQRATGGRTVGQAVEAYIQHLTLAGNKATSIETSGYRLKAMLDYDMALIDLTPTRAADMYMTLVAKGVAVDTHRGSLIGCNAFGKWCAKKKWIKSNPFQTVEGVGKKKRGKKQLRIDHARKFTDHCLKAWAETKDRGAIAGILALLFSARGSEISQLMAGDVDDRGRIIHLADHEAKTEESRRAAKVPRLLRPIVRELADAPALPDGHMFAMYVKGTKRLQPADRHWVLRNVKRHMKLAGVPVITAHGLRGTSATIGTAASGAEVMAGALGHASTSMTERHYIDSDAVGDVRSAQLLDMLLGGDDDEP